MGLFLQNKMKGTDLQNTDPPAESHEKSLAIKYTPSELK